MFLVKAVTVIIAGFLSILALRHVVNGLEAAKVPLLENTACDWSALWTADNGPVGPGLGVCVQQ